MWVVEPSDISRVTRFDTWVYAAEVAGTFKTGEVREHPSGTGWAVWVRIDG